MKQHESFDEAVAAIARQDPRYQVDAYYYLREAFGFAAKYLEKPAVGEGRHISGGELLEAIRVHALQEYGPMAFRLFASWGLHATKDFGELVFNLVEADVFSKTAKDSREDFADVYDFEDAFVKPFLPPSAFEGGGGGEEG